MHTLARLAMAAGLLAVASGAQGVDCPSPSAQTSRGWDAQASAEIGRLGRLRGAQLEARVQSTTQDLLQRLPNADRVYVEQMVFAAYCSALRDDTSLTESVKADRIAAYHRGMAARPATRDR